MGADGSLKYKVLHTEYFGEDIDMFSVNKNIVKAERDIREGVEYSIRQLKYYRGDGERYWGYKKRMKNCLVVYGVLGAGVILNAIMSELGGYTIVPELVLFAFINTLFYVYFYIRYIPVRKWYVQERDEIILAYQTEWQNILDEYRDWCKKNNVEPIKYSYNVDFSE